MINLRLKIMRWFDVFFKETIAELDAIEQKWKNHSKKMDETLDKLLTERKSKSS